ncbi:unnamed protein product, partial [Sphagnum compactum]
SSTAQVQPIRQIKRDIAFFTQTGELSSRLFKLKNALLTVKPTSTDNERVFSTANNFVPPGRS